jgi:hypothetical protein
VIERSLGQPHEHLVEHQGGKADPRLDPAVGGEQVHDPLGCAARDPGAERHAAHERGQHEGLGERCGAEE